MIDPFAFNPARGLNRLIAYWYATWMRVIYRDDNQLSLDVVSIVGANAVLSLPGAPPRCPRVEIITTGTGGVLVHVRGTTAWAEAIFEVAGSLLVPGGSWAGSVSIYFKTLADQIWPVIAPHLADTWGSVGHSMGGAVACLLAGRVAGSNAALCVDAGSPRSGDQTHAAAQTVPRLRLANHGDPIPLLPGSTNSFLDSIPVIIPIPRPPIFYRHWGNHIHLWADTSVTRPPDEWTPTEGAAYLVGGLTLNQGWILAHDTAEYARRLRGGIPIVFPATVPDPDFPDIVQLDAIHQALNDADGIVWRGDGRQGARRPPTNEGEGLVIPPVFRPTACQ